VALAIATTLPTGCVVYETAPGYYATTPPPAFDRAWAAAVGAHEDQGVRITAEDRSSGYVRGTRDGIDVTANSVRRRTAAFGWNSTPAAPPGTTNAHRAHLVRLRPANETLIPPMRGCQRNGARGGRRPNRTAVLPSDPARIIERSTPRKAG
jgi:hypothetical protein